MGFAREWLPARQPGEDVDGVKTLQETQTMVRKGKLVWSEKWFDQGLKKGLKQGRQESQQKALQQGRQEGRQEGRQQGQLEFLLRLVRRRFGDAVAETVRTGIAAMRDPNTLDELGDWLLDCDSADAFLARLKQA